MVKVKRLVALMVIPMMIFAFGAVAGAQDKASDSLLISEAEALNTAQEWSLLVGQANIVGLEKLLSDKYLHIHATALVESKAQFLEAFKNGSRKYDPIKIEEAKARIFDNSAVVTGKFNLKVIARGKTLEGVNRFGLVLVKTRQGIQLVSFQATAIPQPK